MSDPIISSVPLKIVTVKRTHHREDGTFGIMDIDGEPLFLTVELPWRDNKSDVSCIKAGERICERGYSDKFKAEMFFIKDVENRTGVICGHIANTIADLLGCIGIGKEFGKIGEKMAITMSRVAFFDYMARLKNVNQFKLVIQEC